VAPWAWALAVREEDADGGEAEAAAAWDGGRAAAEYGDRSQKPENRRRCSILHTHIAISWRTFCSCIVPSSAEAVIS
jgi:hypothetical protein